MRKDWTGKETKILIELYPNHSNNEIAQILGRSETAIQSKGRALKIQKSPEFRFVQRQQTCRRNRPKGCVWKGLSPKERMTPEKYAAWRSRIESGLAKGRALRIKPEGSRRWNNHKGVEVKIDGKWQREAVVNWCTANGPVPKGMIVVCVDGDRWNTAVDNLALVPICSPGEITRLYPQEKKKAIAQRQIDLREKKKGELDRILAEINKSNNNIHYKPCV